MKRLTAKKTVLVMIALLSAALPHIREGQEELKMQSNVLFVLYGLIPARGCRG